MRRPTDSARGISHDIWRTLTVTGPRFDFDALPDRTGTTSSKWEKYAGRDILPYWVADMDFHTAPSILAALHARIDSGVLGYTEVPEHTLDAAEAYLAREYGWHPGRESILFIPAVIGGFNMAASAVGERGDGVLIPTPVYHPFLDVPRNAEREAQRVPLAASADGRRWEMDFDRLHAAVRPNSRLLLFCNPQNPTGRVYTRAELTQLAGFCLRHGLALCSDEIHCPLVLDPGAVHVPIAALSPEISRVTITLMAPTKAYNVPGVGCGIAVITDAQLRTRFRHAKRGLVPSIGPLAYVATEAAWNDDSGWLPQLLDYLRGNRDLLAATMARLRLPVSHVEGTYLAWIDVRALALEDPGAWFEAHGLGLSDGAQFGLPGYVRFNFGCPRAHMLRGLERFAAAVAARGGVQSNAGSSAPTGP